MALSFHRIVIVLKIEENLNGCEAYNYAFLLPNRNVLWSVVVMIHWRVTFKEGRVAEEKSGRLGAELVAVSLSSLLILPLLSNSSPKSVACLK